MACAQGVPTSVQQPGSWSAAPRLPHLPMSLSQSIGADTPQRASLHRPGQQPRLVTAARYPSVFSRPPVPRSQSPLRRLAERTAERTGSQLLPSQDEPQVCTSGTITAGADVCVAQAQSLQLHAGSLAEHQSECGHHLHAGSAGVPVTAKPWSPVCAAYISARLPTTASYSHVHHLAASHAACN